LTALRVTNPITGTIFYPHRRHTPNFFVSARRPPPHSDSPYCWTDSSRSSAVYSGHASLLQQKRVSRLYHAKSSRSTLNSELLGKDRVNSRLAHFSRSLPVPSRSLTTRFRDFHKCISICRYLATLLIATYNLLRFAEFKIPNRSTMTDRRGR
jgi:hypothetical protein